MVGEAVQQGPPVRRSDPKTSVQLSATVVRHTKRLLAGYRKDGPAALAHGNRGRKPHNAVPETAAAAVVQRRNPEPPPKPAPSNQGL